MNCDGISIDLLEFIFTFLWFDDIICLATVCERFKSASFDSNFVARELLSNLLSRTGRFLTNFNDVLRSNDCYSASQLYEMAHRITPWPTEIDLIASLKNTDMKHIQFKSKAENWINHFECNHILAYQGDLLGRNRSIVANDQFPSITLAEKTEDGSTKSLTSSVLPFTKTVAINTNESSVFLSTIAYFEVIIHNSLKPNPNVIATQNLDAQYEPCVVIGLSLPSTKIHSMPGWCPRSYGYHGDDGLFYHNCGHQGIPLNFLSDSNLNEGDLKFGAGDTVGCGLSYVHNGEISPLLFFTKNGVLVGMKSVSHLFMDIGNPLFPVIGTDCYSPIEVNFGTDGRPFAFDIIQLERDLHQYELVSHEPIFSTPPKPKVPTILPTTINDKFLKNQLKREERVFFATFWTQFDPSAYSKTSFTNIHKVKKFRKYILEDICAYHPMLFEAYDISRSATCADKRYLKTKIKSNELSLLSTIGRSSSNNQLVHVKGSKIFTESYWRNFDSDDMYESSFDDEDEDCYDNEEDDSDSGGSDEVVMKSIKKTVFPVVVVNNDDCVITTDITAGSDSTADGIATTTSTTNEEEILTSKRLTRLLTSEEINHIMEDDMSLFLDFSTKHETEVFINICLDLMLPMMDTARTFGNFSDDDDDDDDDDDGEDEDVDFEDEDDDDDDDDDGFDGGGIGNFYDSDSDRSRAADYEYDRDWLDANAL